MRIAILAHVRHPVASPFAGGMEAQCWHLAEGMERRGHAVVLFASGDSDSRFAIDPVVPVHYERTHPDGDRDRSATLTAYLDAAYASACDRIAGGGFDVVLNNSLHRFPLEPRRTAAVPTVTSLHVPPYDALRWFVHASPSPTHRLTATSRHHLDAWWPDGAPAAASVLYNGIDTAAWPYAEHGDGSAIWFGRIAPEKGTHFAIAAAKRAGVGLHLFGPISDQAYWESAIAPHLGQEVQYGGHLSGPELARRIGRASVALFTPCWNEPFGLAAIEAMACGLPISAFDRGATREIVGPAGRYAVAGDQIGLADAIREAMKLPRVVSRNRAQTAFSKSAWLDGIERLQRQVRFESAA